MEAAIVGLLALVAIPVIRAAIKSYRAKKAVADILVDAVEAAVDAVDKK
jgi:Tfp pilus assembly protein PilE